MILRSSEYGKINTADLDGLKSSSGREKKNKTVHLKQGWEELQGRRNFHCEEAESINPIPK